MCQLLSGDNKNINDAFMSLGKKKNEILLSCTYDEQLCSPRITSEGVKQQLLESNTFFN